MPTGSAILPIKDSTSFSLGDVRLDVKVNLLPTQKRGFGIFNVRPRKTGIGRNPRTGAEVAIPPGKAVRFKPGKELQTLQ